MYKYEMKAFSLHWIQYNDTETYKSVDIWYSALINKMRKAHLTIKEQYRVSLAYETSSESQGLKNIFALRCRPGDGNISKLYKYE
jgi:hypothetical protein